MWVCDIHIYIYIFILLYVQKLHPEKWNLQKWNRLTISMSNCCFTEPFFTSAFNTRHRWVEDNFWVRAGWRISKNDCNAGWKLFSIHHGRTFETLFFGQRLTVWLHSDLKMLMILSTKSHSLTIAGHASFKTGILWAVKHPIDPETVRRRPSGTAPAKQPVTPAPQAASFKEAAS